AERQSSFQRAAARPPPYLAQPSDAAACVTRGRGRHRAPADGARAWIRLLPHAGGRRAATRRRGTRGVGLPMGGDRPARRAAGSSAADVVHPSAGAGARPAARTHRGPVRLPPAATIVLAADRTTER